MPGDAPTLLAGRRILVAEDEYMIAEEMAEMLLQAGAVVLGPVAGIADVLDIISAEARVDGALLDVNLRGEVIWPAVDTLQRRGVPIVLTSGYSSGVIPSAYAHLPRCEKPSSERDLRRALIKAMTSHPLDPD